MIKRRHHLLVACFLLAIAACGTAAPTRTAAPAPLTATVVVSKADLAGMGFTFGADSMVTRYTAGDGSHIALFTATRHDQLDQGFELYEFRTGSDLSGVSLLQQNPVLRPGREGQTNPVSWCRSAPCFDRDYSGGGTVVQCPGRGPLLMAYHGENHTAPSGQVVARQGWTGIGLARWNAQTDEFDKVDQIIGLNAGNEWQQTAAGWKTEQTPGESFQGDMVITPDGRSVYLYYGDADSSGKPGISMASIGLAQLCSDAATGKHAAWKKWSGNSFSAPGLFTQDSAGHPAGTGGTSTHIISDGGATSPSVMVVDGRWYMVTTPRHQAIHLYISTDGIHWSTPRTVYTNGSGEIRYATITPDSGVGAFVSFTWDNGEVGDPARSDFAIKGVKIPAV